jgi:NADPH:quinone reductase-like Zn-dependent oxidoreductase
MRAFAVRSFGEAPAVHDLPVPAAGDAFLLRVTYAGVNPLDNNNLARLDGAGQVLDKLRTGGLRGKAVIRL